MYLRTTLLDAWTGSHDKVGEEARLSALAATSEAKPLRLRYGLGADCGRTGEGKGRER